MTLTAPSRAQSRDVRAVRAAAGAITVTTVSVLPVFLTGALAVQLGDELGFNPAGLGLVVALYFGVSALCSLPVGRLVERWGGAVTSRIAVLGVAVVMLVLAVFADSYASLVAILLCGAWCNVMGQLASNLTLARSVPAHRLGLSFGVKQAAIPLSTLLAGAAVPAVALTVGWRWAYVIASGLALLALLGAPRSGEYVRVPKPPPGERATLALAVLGAGSGLGAGAANALGIFLVAAAVDRGIDPGMAGLVLTFGSVVGFAGRLLHGWLADRRTGGHVAFVAGSMAIGAVGLVLLAVPGTPALTIGTILGFGLGWSWPGLMQFAVVRLNPSAPAAASAIVQTGVYAGGFAGPIAFGFVAARSSFDTAWLAAAATMVAAALLVVLGRRLLVAHRAARRRPPELSERGVRQIRLTQRRVRSVRRPTCRLSTDPLGERDRVERGVHLDVVVEVDEHVPRRPVGRRRHRVLAHRRPAREPLPHPLRPPVERIGRIAADVELGVAVQADVDEAGGHVLEVRELPGRVGHDERDVVRAQQRDERRVPEALVADLHGVPQRTVGIDGRLRPPVEPRVVLAGQLRRRARAARQQREELVDPRRIEAQPRR